MVIIPTYFKRFLVYLYFLYMFMISMDIYFTLSAQILHNHSETINYFRETKSIRKLILINFTDNIIIKTTVWEKVKLL